MFDIFDHFTMIEKFDSYWKNMNSNFPPLVIISFLKTLKKKKKKLQLPKKSYFFNTITKLWLLGETQATPKSGRSVS